jgi:hypothetical protein
MEGKTIERPALFDPQIGPLYQQALTFYRNRRLDEAAACCQRILAIRTNESNAVRLLKEIATLRETVPPHDPGAALRQRVRGIVLPEFNAVNAIVQDLVGHLQRESGKLTADKVPVNLIWNVPAGEKVPTVTFHYFKMPLADALRYVTEGNGLACRYDENAVVIVKAPAVPPPAVEGAERVLGRKLRETILPQYQAVNLPVHQAVLHLQRLAGRVAADQTPVNVVWTVPVDEKLPPVNLELYQISQADALRYITEVAGLRYRVDERAVVISVAEPAKSVTVQNVNQ